MQLLILCGDLTAQIAGKALVLDASVRVSPGEISIRVGEWSKVDDTLPNMGGPPPVSWGAHRSPTEQTGGGRVNPLSV